MTGLHHTTEILDLLTRLAGHINNPTLEAFINDLPGSPDQVREREPRALPVLTHLDAAVQSCPPAGRPVLEYLQGFRDALFWGQTYNADDFGSHRNLPCGGWTPTKSVSATTRRKTRIWGFWLFGSAWTRVDAGEVSEASVSSASSGVVGYASGEILCQFGEADTLPAGFHFMSGPTYFDKEPGFRRRLVRNGKGGAQVEHGASRSQQGDPQRHYATKLTNLTERPVRVTKFAPFPKGFFGVPSEPPKGYYSPTQFREWFRVSDPDGWIQPGESVCDPDNYAWGRGVWAYFLEDDRGERFIATAPLKRKI